MNRTLRKAPALLMTLMMLLVPAYSVGIAHDDPTGPGPVGAPGPMAEPTAWSDSLDDLSHVYVPPGGLVGVEVSGGDAHLLTGYNEGWLASSVITCPQGYKYDLVYIEADTPGASYIKITILDALTDPTEVGYANETVPNHVKVDGPDHSVFDIGPTTYPAIRIQINLYASGTDMPRLLSWRLYYTGTEEWHDDFLGSAKMLDHKGINVTGGAVTANLSRKGAGSEGGGYEAYPPVLFSRYGATPPTFDAFYPNSGRTGYNDKVSVTATGAYGFAFGFLDGDGYLDLVVAKTGSDSQIWWGSSSGTWSATGAKNLKTTGPSERAAVGDFNGDGWGDIVITGTASGSGNTFIFLNQGDGTFDAGGNPSVTFTGEDAAGVDAGDLNNDGYDDFVLAQSGSCHVFFGGSSGPDTTADISLPAAGGYVYDVLVKDLDLDGYLDVTIACTISNNAPVYLGGANGPDTTADFSLNVGNYCMDVDAGDINGDGYIDIVYGVYGTSAPVYEGTSTGWSTSKRHDLNVGGGSNYPLRIKVVDIDLDGYDDVLMGVYTGGSTYGFLVFKGGATWPTTPTITKSNSLYYPTDIGVAVPKGGGGKGYSGYLTTQPIYINQTQKWDILLLEGTMPQNTTVSISILDGSGKELTGWTDLTDWNIDLFPLTGQSPIMINVKVTSEFNWTTPVLERLTVKWMAKGYWREQFYGPAKIERRLNVGVTNGELTRAIGMGMAPQLLVTSLRSDSGYATKPLAFVDSGGLDYLSLPPMAFEAKGVVGADAADVNGDGFVDVVFAVNRISDSVYDSPSLLFLGSAVGFRSMPERSFPTVGATDVLLRDLNGDGPIDIVFSQETDGATPRINSSLYWGLAGGGWADGPDVEFETNGASGVAAADLDGDGDLDLAFACQRDASTTSLNSMVFMQDANGYCGTAPSHLLPTLGATSVAAGDINGDGRQDLLFTNSFHGGSTEIDSYIYLGKAGGGFESTPETLKTVGAEDVKVADLDGDGDLDVVFANAKNNVPSYKVDSYVYLNEGSGTFPTDPSTRLPTMGAAAVAVADLDGTGRKDLVFACQQNGTSFNVRSIVYLGGATGWSSTPDIVLPTVGASDAIAVDFIGADAGGYMSKIITPENPAETGAFHTFKYTAALGAQQAGRVQLIDATSWAVLAETALQSGPNEWVVKDLFWVKEHPKIRVVVTVSGLDQAGTFTLDELYLNWTKRVKEPPRVLDVGASPSSLLRLKSGALWVNVTDEYDPPMALRMTVEHRLNGTTVWSTDLFGTPTYLNDSWRLTVLPRADASIGMYDVRVSVIDSDSNTSGYVVFMNVLEVRNNIPTAPVVRIVPEAPLTTTALRAEIDTPATDVETGVVYRFKWFRDGELVEALTEDTVTSAFTSRGENWSVEVRAFDGIDEGPPAFAWAIIKNAPPQVAIPLPDPELLEDTVDDKWLDLGKSFSDPDGDALTYSVTDTPVNIQVDIDPATGKVTLTPAENWYGQENVTFVASDGVLSQTQTVLITVTPVNDAPRFTTLNGEPIEMDPVPFDVAQGGVLTITVGTEDVEGDDLVFSVNTTVVDVNPDTGELRFQPGNEAVGTVRFALTMYDVASPDVKVRVNIAITVVNVNDPPGEARITNPRNGDTIKANTTFSLLGVCTDPDTPFGQVLTYKWFWNGTNLIGEGSSRTTMFTDPGTYVITLNVTDGEYFSETSITIIIEPRQTPQPPPPPPPPDDEDKGLGAVAWIGALVALVVIGGVIFLVVARKRAAEQEAADEEAEKRAAFKQMAVAVKETAEEMEREVAETRAERAAAPKAADLEEIKVESLGGPVPAKRGLSMEAKVTEQASKEVEQLFEPAATPAAAVSAEDTERMRIENLKRKYQTAISRLPYGIPADALKDKDWTWLASALATGEKKTVPDGHEVTRIEGHWYYSDVKDASSFLKEHGTKPKAAARPAARPAARKVDKAALLEKLEERFILGEISEESYKELKRKFEAEMDAKEELTGFEWVEDK